MLQVRGLGASGRTCLGLAILMWRMRTGESVSEAEWHSQRKGVIPGSDPDGIHW